jgi:hypothetical protein
VSPLEVSGLRLLAMFLYLWLFREIARPGEIGNNSGATLAQNGGFLTPWQPSRFSAFE